MDMKLTKEQLAWAGIRLVLGWMFLWAFFDKMFGLGYATASKSAWINGGSPTEGYLKYATSGPLSGFYHSLSGNVGIDVLFMLGLLVLGVGVMLGIGTKITSIIGAIFVTLLWSTNLPPANNPIVDEHIIYLLLFIAMYFVRPGRWIGLGELWRNTSIVKALPILE